MKNIILNNYDLGTYRFEPTARKIVYYIFIIVSTNIPIKLLLTLTFLIHTYLIKCKYT